MMKKKMQKRYNDLCGKRGFTLVELCVVLAVIAIVITMITTFSVLMGGYASDTENEVEFLEDCAEARESFYSFAAEQDSVGAIFTVGADGRLSITDGEGSAVPVSFEDGALTLGERVVAGLKTVETVTFSADDGGSVIKCTVWRNGKVSEHLSSSFIFHPRCATIVKEAENG